MEPSKIGFTWGDKSKVSLRRMVSRFPQLSRKWCQVKPNMAPKWSQDDQQIDPKTSKFKPKCRRRARKWGPNGVKKGSTRRKNQRKTPTHQKRGMDFTALPLLSRKSGQHGPNLGPKMEPRWPKNRCKNASFF